MTTPIFQDLYYHIQIYDIEYDLLWDYRRKLERNGARYCADPCDPRCEIIFVETAKKCKGFNYKASDQAGDYEEHKPIGSWTYDAICTHFSIRTFPQYDLAPARRKHVVAVQWVDECLEKGRRLVEERYARWDVKVLEQPPRHKSHSKARLDFAPPLLEDFVGSQSPMTGFAALLASQELQNVPSTPITSNPPIFTPTHVDDPTQIPPSPPLTATSSMAGSSTQKVFESLTHDQLGARTFHVASPTNRFMMEFFIKTNGGMLEDQMDATFIIVDRPASNDLASTRQMLGKLRRTQIVVTPQWVEECVRLNTIVDIGEYTINLQADSTPTSKPAVEEKPPAVPATFSAALVEKPSLKRARSQTINERDDTVIMPLMPIFNQRPSGTIPIAVDPRVRPRLSTEASATPPPAYKIKPSPPSTITPIGRSATPALLLLPSEDELQARILDTQSKTTTITVNDPKLARPDLGSTIRHRKKPSTPEGTAVDVPMTPARTATQDQPDTPPLPSHFTAASAQPTITPTNGKFLMADSQPTAISQIRLIPAEWPELPPFSFDMAPLPDHSAHPPTPSTPVGEEFVPIEAPSPYYPSEPPSPSRYIDPGDYFEGPPSPEYYLPEVPSFSHPPHQLLPSSHADQGQDQNMSATPSPSSTEPSSTTGRLEAGTHSAFSSKNNDDPFTSSTTTKPKTLNIVFKRPTLTEPILTIGAAVRLDELIGQLDKWLKNASAEIKTHFLKTLRTMGTGFDWHSLFYRMRGSIRTRLLAMGHQAAALDRMGILPGMDRQMGKGRS